MKNKQAFTREVIWNLRSKNINPGLQANNELKKRLGEELASHFARMNVGSSYYEWLVDDESLSVLSSASPEEKARVMAKLEEISAEVHSKINIPGYADCLMKYPNDDFVYYAIDLDGTVRVLLTGWGCSNYNAARGGRAVKSIREKEKISIAFLYGGRCAPQRKFNISRGGQPNSNYLVTDDEGCYSMSEPVEVDTLLKVFDVDTLKTFDLKVVSGQQLYEFDVTEYSAVSVLVRKDGQPVADEPVSVNYDGQVSEPSTSVTGQLSLSLPFVADAEVKVKVAGQEQIQTVSKAGNQFVFTLEEEQPPVVDLVIPVVQVLDANGRPVPDYVLEISQEQVVSTVQTNGEGRATLSAVMAGTEVKVADLKDKSQIVTYLVTAEDNHFVYQLKGHPTVVTVFTANGRPLADTPIDFQQGEEVKNLILDANGSCTFLAEDFVAGQQIVAKVDIQKDVRCEIPFVLEEGEYEYQLIEEKTKRSPLFLLLEILLFLLLLVVLFYLAGVFIDNASWAVRGIRSIF